LSRVSAAWRIVSQSDLLPIRIATRGRLATLIVLFREGFYRAGEE
jgi:hypothetical protein